MHIYVNGTDREIAPGRIGYNRVCELAGINPETTPQVTFQAAPPYGRWANIRPGQSILVTPGTMFVVEGGAAICHDVPHEEMV